MSDSAESLPSEAGQPLDHLSEDISDEIADHLTLSAAELVRHSGCSGEDARRAATAKFGNVTLVRWKCWWVKQGDFVMRRAAIIAIVVLAVGLLVAGVALPTLASLRSMRDNVDKLTEQLAALTKAQQELVEKQTAAQAPVELRGKCFLKTEDQPAVGAHVGIWDAEEMKCVRNVSTDEKGEFSSGPLKPGTYFAMTPLIGKENPKVDWSIPGSKTGYASPTYAAQSNVEYLYPGVRHEPIAFDLYFPKGDLGFQLEQPLPATMKLGKDQTEFALQVTVGARNRGLAFLPWNPSGERTQATSWPLVGERGDLLTSGKLFGNRLANREPVWIAGQSDPERGEKGPQKLIFAGKYECAAVLTIVPNQNDPFDDKYSGQKLRQAGIKQPYDLTEWARGVPTKHGLKTLPVGLRDGTLQTVRIKSVSAEVFDRLANEKPDGFTVPLELEIGSSEPLPN